MPVVRLLVDRDADAGADLFRFFHHTGAEAAHQLVVQHLGAGGPGDGADRVHGHVAPQLEPDVALYPVRQRGFKTGALQQSGQRDHARAAYARGFADYEFVAEPVAYHTRRADGTTGVYHAAHDVFRRYGRGDLTTRIDGRQLPALQRTAKALQEPPGYAVHGG